MPEPSETWVWVARIRRPQGRKGEVFAEILTDFPEKFAERRRLWLIAASGKRAESAAPKGEGPGAPDSKRTEPAREVELAAYWLHKGGVVLHFAGVDSISTAETLNGMMVAIPRAERAALDEDEAYVGDLIGCVLVDLSGPAPVRVGEIIDVDGSAGAAPLLVVAGAKGEVLVPFAKSYLRNVDLARKKVEMALPEGLIDLSKAEEA